MSARWLFGDAGTRALHEISQSYEQLVRNEAPSSGGNFVVTPWIACRSQWAKTSAVLMTESARGFVRDPVTLTALREAFHLDDMRPLGRLNDEANWGLNIATLNNPEEVRGLDRIESATERLRKTSPRYRKLFGSVVSTFVPLIRTNNIRSHRAAFSSHLARGALFLTIPVNDTLTAKIDTEVDLVHELGHSALILYQAADPIFVGDSLAPTYSGIRKTMRPAIMSLHAATALAFMLEYLTSRFQRAPEEEIRSYLISEINSYTVSLQATLQGLAGAKLTDIGKAILRELREQLFTSAPNLSESMLRATSL